MTGKYELILTSYIDCDDFVVEVWLQDNLVAVLKEDGEIQLFKDVSDKTFFESREFAAIIAEAKEKLGIEQIVSPDAIRKQQKDPFLSPCIPTIED